MKIHSKVEVGAIVQYLYMYLPMSWKYTNIYLDGEHCTLTIENVLSASYSCKFQMAASIKTIKIDLRESLLYSTGLLKKHSLIQEQFSTLQKADGNLYESAVFSDVDIISL